MSNTAFILLGTAALIVTMFYYLSHFKERHTRPIWRGIGIRVAVTIAFWVLAFVFR